MIVAARFGQREQNGADINGDGVVDIFDLVTVASALSNAGLRTLIPQTLAILTAAEIEDWLLQAQGLPLTDATLQRGILFLKQLLATLTPQETTLIVMKSLLSRKCFSFLEGFLVLSVTPWWVYETKIQPGTPTQPSEGAWTMRNRKGKVFFTMKYKSVLAISLCFSIFLTTALSSDEKSESQSELQQEDLEGIPKRITGKDGTPMVLIPGGGISNGQ